MSSFYRKRDPGYVHANFDTLSVRIIILFLEDCSDCSNFWINDVANKELIFSSSEFAKASAASSFIPFSFDPAQLAVVDTLDF